MKTTPGALRACALHFLTKQKGTEIPTERKGVAGVLFFDGEVPDISLMRTILKRSGGKYVNTYDLVNTYMENYMGVLYYRLGFNSVLVRDGAQGGTLDLQLSEQAPSLMAVSPVVDGENDPASSRTAKINRTGRPTWFCLAYTENDGYIFPNGDNPILSATYAENFLLFGTAGDEDSSAELKIVGGQIFQTTGSTEDYSRVPIISNLRIQFK